VRDADSKPLNPRSPPEVCVTVIVTNCPALRRTGQLTLTKVAPSLVAWSRSKQARFELLPLIAMAG